MGLFGALKKSKKTIVDEKHVNKIVDYTQILPSLTKKELEKKICIAYKNRYYSICVNPINVKFAHDYISLKLKSAIKLVSVIGFPLGENTTDSKVYEAKKAISDGADEIDVVIAVSRVKMSDWGYIKNEISRIVKAAKKHVVKIIIETALLTKAETQKLAQIALKYKVDYIQTSTGFANGGATIEDVELLSETLGGRCLVKASGAVENRNQAIIMLRAGASRIGTSREI